MKVFKFGGASLQSAENIRRLPGIIKSGKGRLIVVLSAMGKTTNALEEICWNYFHRKDFSKSFEALKNFHIQILKALDIQVFSEVESLFDELNLLLNQEAQQNYDVVYDTIIPFGELFSSKIIGLFLKKKGFDFFLADARKLIRTDTSFRQAKVDMDESAGKVKDLLASTDRNILTQGFIGSSPDGRTTSLGREGSDYSAALFAALSEAQSCTIWKDVDGVFNADPARFPNPVLLQSLTFNEAIELAYCGAKVIHPKTIQPLKALNIPLYVKSFFRPEKEGSCISAHGTEVLPPCYILKENQALITVSSDELDFYNEKVQKAILEEVKKVKSQVNITEHSAVSYSFCIDYDPIHSPELISILQKKFKVRFNIGVKLLTIRHYQEESIEKARIGKKIFIEQRSRLTIRIVYTELNKHE